MSLWSGCPVTKTSCCCCYNHAHTYTYIYMVVTTQIVKKKERKKRTKERTKKKKTKRLTQQESRAHMHAYRRHHPISENEWGTDITQRQHIYDREAKEEKYMKAHTFRAQNKERSAMLKEKNVLSLSSSLMLSLLHLIQVQTDCFLLYCDCTIELCCTILSYSVYHHR